MGNRHTSPDNSPFPDASAQLDSRLPCSLGGRTTVPKTVSFMVNNEATCSVSADETACDHVTCLQKQPGCHQVQNGHGRFLQSCVPRDIAYLQQYCLPYSSSPGPFGPSLLRLCMYKCVHVQVRVYVCTDVWMCAELMECLWLCVEARG